MRTLDLLRALSDKEQKEIALIVSESKRPRVTVLLHELIELLQSDSEPDNAELFKKIFDKPYTRTQDYLLRNEIRHLNEILYRYLADQAALAQIRRSDTTLQYWLSTAYYERRMYDLLGSDIDGFIDHADISMAERSIANLSKRPSLLNLKVRWMMETHPKLPANIEEQLEVIRQWKMEEKRWFLYQLREIESREAYLQIELAEVLGRDASMPDDMRTPGEAVIDLSALEDQGPMIRYMLLKKHANQTRGALRIEVLREMLDLVSTPDAVKLLSIEPRLITLNLLGVESILAGKYEDGEKYLRENIAESMAHKWPKVFSAIHNYITNLINLGRYREGAEMYEQHRRLIDDQRLRHPTRLSAAYCYLYMGDDDRATALLPRPADLNAVQRIQARYVLPISYLMRREYALAVSEIRNLRRTIKALKTPDVNDQIEIIDLYLKYATAYTKDKYTRETSISSLKADVKADMPKWRQWAANQMQLHWLLDKLKI